MNGENLLKDLAEIIAIPSVLEPAALSAPFGKENRRALDWFLAKSKSYGLTAKDCDGYCGYAELGEGEELIGVLTHLDVVPAGSGWSAPPYALNILNGQLYGRGVVDDKGPMVIILNILKDIKERGIKLKRRIRLIAGCNEENGSACMKFYVKREEIPSLSFTPDSDFPIIGSEKGIMHLEATLKRDGYLYDNIADFSAGSRPNVVPDTAEITVIKNSPLYRSIEKLCDGKITDRLFSSPCIAAAIVGDGNRINDFYLMDNGNITLGAKGVSGHAMCPDKGENAVWKIISLLHALTNESPAVEKLYGYIARRDALRRLDIYGRDEESGELTVNLGLIHLTSGVIKITLDFRIPISLDKNKIACAVQDKLAAKTQIKYYAENLFINPADPTLNLLLDVYHRNTGREKHIIQSGGGTYARELPNAVAFGPTFEDIETNIHNADETISVENFYLLYKIYYDAILSLCT